MYGPLSEMVRAANNAGISFDRLVKRGGTDPAGKPNFSRSFLVDLVNGKVNRAPEPYVIRALARALDKPLGQVQLAVAKQFLELTLPIPTELDEDTEAIMTGVLLAPEHRRRWLRRIVETPLYDPDDSGE